MSLTAACILALLMAPLFAVARQPSGPQEKAAAPALTSSAYDASDDIFYQFMPIAWRYGECADLPAQASENRFGNFQVMIDSLPYLKTLGVTGVWMTPIFPSPAYHGYQHGAADRLNPWFGPEGDFLRFVREARTAGIKVYLDLVTYGISQDSEWFKDAYKNPSSPFAKQLAFTDDACTKFLGHSYTSWNGSRVTFINWDLRSAEARARVIAWSKKWLDPNGDGDPSDGIAGYRLDHVWARYAPQGKPAPDGWGYNIDSFWMEWKRELQKVNPKVFTFAEQAKWETFGADLLPAHDAAFSKPFEAAAREALKAEDATKLYESMAATLAALPKGRTFLLTLGDHDVDRLASAIGADEPGHECRARAAAAVLMLGPLPPVIYYGEELGMRGKAGKFGGDANDLPRREPMKWKAVAGPPMSNYFALHTGAYEKRYEHDHDGRSVEEQDGAKGSLLELYRELAKVRMNEPALRRGHYEPLPCSSKAVWRFRMTVEPGGHSVEVAINLSGKEVSLTSPTGGALLLEAYGWRVSKSQ
jgi:glycosidase